MHGSAISIPYLRIRNYREKIAASDSAFPKNADTAPNTNPSLENCISGRIRILGIGAF